MSVLNQSGDEAVECPLCMEPLEVDDLNFFPCTCLYQICRFCWHRIRTDENGLCPACRKAYSENPADFKPLTKEEISRLKAEKRLKDQQRKQRVTENRKHLANVRVVQKNLVFVVGLPMRLADADVLKRHEYFGKFGKIHKVVINQSTSYAGSQGPSASAYVTYQRQEDALRAIEAVNNIVVDARTIKTSLGTTKYCSHFMRNQSCPKPDCMYLHDLGDQEASFTKEEMHQGKHQEYERKLVQSLHAHASSGPRKPTPSPPATGTTVRENGTTTSQVKEAWPSLQPGQTNNTQTNIKESSPPTQTNTQPGVVITNVTSSSSNPVSSNGSSQTSSSQPQQSSQQNNNNKGENVATTVSRRGKSNSESKVQAARNKHKNNQNKEKHGANATTSVVVNANTANVANTSTRSTSRSESSSTSSSQSSVQPIRVNGQNKEIRGFENLENLETTNVGTAKESQIRQNGRCKVTDNSLTNGRENLSNQQTNLSRHQRSSNLQIETEIDEKMGESMGETMVNCVGDLGNVGVGQIAQMQKNLSTNGERRESESESDNQREGSTPASTVSSSEECSSASANQRIDGLGINHDNHRQRISDSPNAVLGESLYGARVGTDSSQTTNSNLKDIVTRQTSPPGLHGCPVNIANGALTQQMQLNHRSIFQTDNNSFFSSNSFQKVSTLVNMQPHSHTGNANLDWTNTCLAPIPDSLPSVHSSEDWQAAFGFHAEKFRMTSNHIAKKPSPPGSPNVSFNNENFIDDEDYLNSQYATSPAKISRGFDPNVHVNSPASKFMADFQQNSLQQRLALQSQQNHENCEYIKQNGHGGPEGSPEGFPNQSHDGSSTGTSAGISEIKPDDDLGFDPFHETQKALAEIIANEVQTKTHRDFQHEHHQQMQQQRDREEQNRLQQQGLAAIGSQHFTQVHLAHFQQQANHLQNIHVLHQSHSLLSRLPQNLIQQQQPQQQQQQQQQQQSAGGQNGAGQQTSMPANALGQRSRLPPPGFPGSTPNHMNSFGLGIPRPAPTNTALAAAQPPQQGPYLPNGNSLLTSQGVNKCAAEAVYSLKDWCEINGQQQQQQLQHQQQFHHQSLHQKSGWNNFGPIADWTSIDPAIVSSSRPLSFQATSTWQFPRAHQPLSVPHNAQQEQNAPAQHWAMQPPPGFGGPSISSQINSQQANTVAQPHTSTKLISAGSEIENM